MIRDQDRRTPPDHACLGRWQQLGEHGQVMAAGGCKPGDASMSIPIT
jgi:hypothetical protein